MEQLDIDILGRVQGVHYRTAITGYANTLGIHGFAESKNDGTVHIVAQGERDNLEEFLRLCQRGSFLSKVEGLSFKFGEAKEEYNKFEIKINDNILKDKIIGFKNLGKRITKKIIGIESERKVPNHIVIIPDGNRRWAREKNWHPWVGHFQVATRKDRLLDLFKECVNLGVKYATLWGFSTENWTRDEKEVNMLFNLFRKASDQYLKEFKKNGVKFRQIGRRDRIPADIREKIELIERETKDNTVLNVQFALDYGGRDELLRAISKMQADNVTNFDEETIKNYLDTPDIPDPDLIIRTSGEKRTSGVFVWQGAYAELYFTNVMFPDFTPADLRLAVLDYGYRTRRFGGTAESDLNNIDPAKLTTPDEKEVAALALG